MISFTIPLEPKTKKNSQRIITRKDRYGRPRPMIIPSQSYTEYEREAVKYCPKSGIDYAVNVRAFYFRKKHHRVDLTNLESALMDTLVKAGTLKDDSCNIVWSTDGSRVFFDADNPRTEVMITAVVKTEKPQEAQLCTTVLNLEAEKNDGKNDN